MLSEGRGTQAEPGNQGDEGGSQGGLHLAKSWRRDLPREKVPESCKGPRQVFGF